jgi:hypothetical protein
MEINLNEKMLKKTLKKTLLLLLKIEENLFLFLFALLKYDFLDMLILL